MVGYSGFEPLTSSMSSRFEAATRKDGVRHARIPADCDEWPEIQYIPSTRIVL